METEGEVEMTGRLFKPLRDSIVLKITLDAPETTTKEKAQSAKMEVDEIA